MKVAFSAGIFPPDIGGPADFVPRFAAWLVGRGHIVTVVCWSDAVEHPDAAIYPFRVVRISRRLQRLARSWQTIAAMMQTARLADVIFANTLDLEAHTAARLLGKPIVHKVVGDRAWEIARSRRWFGGTLDAFQTAPKSPRLTLVDWLRSYPLLRADRVIVPSRYLAGIVSGWHVRRDRIQLIHNSSPVNHAGGDLELPRFDGRTIATVCRLAPWKGVDRLITVVRDLPGTRLVIAGDGPERFSLEALAAQTGVTDRVIFLGSVSKPNVRALLDASDVFVLNSSYEGLPHVVLEAMAAGVPVVATDVGGTREAVQHEVTGLLVPYGNNGALRSSLERLLRSPDVARRLAAAAKMRLLESFNEEMCFESYETALTDVAAGRTHSRPAEG